MNRKLNENSVRVGKQRTSMQAASVAYPKSGTKRLKVYEFIVRQGMRGATDQEIQDSLHIDGNTVRPTRGSLVIDGFVIDTGETRPNPHGLQCIVWRAVEIGMML